MLWDGILITPLVCVIAQGKMSTAAPLDPALKHEGSSFQSKEPAFIKNKDRIKKKTAENTRNYAKKWNQKWSSKCGPQNVSFNTKRSRLKPKLVSLLKPIFGFSISVFWGVAAVFFSRLGCDFCIRPCSYFMHLLEFHTWYQMESACDEHGCSNATCQHGVMPDVQNMLRWTMMARSLSKLSRQWMSLVRNTLRRRTLRPTILKSQAALPATADKLRNKHKWYLCCMMLLIIISWKEWMCHH